MATNNTLNSVGGLSTPVRFLEGQSASYLLTPTAYTGYVILERGESLNAMVEFQRLASNASGVLYGPPQGGQPILYRFRMAQNYVSGSVATTINDPAITSLNISRTIAMTQAAYNALVAPDPSTMYVIVG